MERPRPSQSPEREAVIQERKRYVVHRPYVPGEVPEWKTLRSLEEYRRFIEHPETFRPQLTGIYNPNSDHPVAVIDVPANYILREGERMVYRYSPSLGTTFPEYTDNSKGHLAPNQAVHAVWREKIAKSLPSTQERARSAEAEELDLMELEEAYQRELEEEKNGL